MNSRPDRPSRRRIVLVLSAAVLVASAGAAQAHSGKPQSLTTIQVKAQYTEPAGSWDGVGCSGLSTASPSCKARLTGYANYTGTLYGGEYYDMEGTATTDGRIVYEGPGHHTGGVRGCGKGSYILDNTEGYIDMTKYDPVTNSAPGFNKWSYRPGSGTGELRNLVSGSGVNHWTVYFSGAVGARPSYGDGEFTGSIRCNARKKGA